MIRLEICCILYC